MHKIFLFKIGWMLILYVFLDLVCAGMGMGVPFFCILFGMLVGWYIVQRVTVQPRPIMQVLEKILAAATLTSAFTFLIMILIWSPSIPLLFNPQVDLRNFGIPLILYEPRLSFIGWMVLMILISPFLQLLMTIFGAYLTLLWKVRGICVSNNDEKV